MNLAVDAIACDEERCTELTFGERKGNGSNTYTRSLRIIFLPQAPLVTRLQHKQRNAWRSRSPKNRSPANMDPPAHTKPDTANPSQPHLTFVC